MNSEREKRMYAEKRKWIYGKILMEDGICLIENEEGDLFLVESLISPGVFISIDGEWLKAELFDQFAVTEHSETIQLKGGESIRYLKTVKQAFLEFLEGLDNGRFYSFLEQLNDLGFSVFDCVYAYNGLCFISEKKGAKGVSFYQFSNDLKQCALQHHYERNGDHKDRFEWTTSDGERIVTISASKPPS
ncbi:MULTISPECIES: DUF2777 domain-containing protein [Bacillus]|uniref:DUF2777 domain-containing protein n=1 Tax=Bacillus TaxID=1386 RepID=UPI000478D397|nr:MULTISPECIES: DUF2777 domain-containing protein [Bacillus]QHZ46184.1 DUF2777 domain-containing protein [Bacillus sp. NSP9.1]WFA06407.1 DUF2777 domain-containing protein [Bacillus sp. HSf4]